MSGMVLNFSGHKLNTDAINILKEQYQVVFEADPIDFDFASDVEEQLSAVISAIPFAVDGRIPVTIIPPGQATLAVLLVSFLHGAIGHFPKLCYLERTEEGVYLPQLEYEIAVQGIRSAGRRYRSRIMRIR